MTPGSLAKSGQAGEKLKEKEWACNFEESRNEKVVIQDTDEKKNERLCYAVACRELSKKQWGKNLKYLEKESMTDWLESTLVAMWKIIWQKK